MKCSFRSQPFFLKKPQNNKKAHQTKTSPTKQNQPKATLKDKDARVSLSFAEITMQVQASCTKLPLLFSKPVKKHKSKCKYFRGLPLKLQT